MHLKRVCYNRIRGEFVRSQRCPLLPIDKWVESRLKAAETNPATVYPVVDADVRFSRFCSFQMLSLHTPCHRR